MLTRVPPEHQHPPMVTPSTHFITPTWVTGMSHHVNTSTHLTFVDDIMFLSRGDIPSVSTMFAKLQHFCRVSRLSISSDKSAIYSAGIRPYELSHIQQLG